jgi:hypothetical protein
VFGEQLRDIYHWVFRWTFDAFGGLTIIESPLLLETITSKAFIVVNILILILLKTITSLLWAVMCGDTSVNHPISEEPLRGVFAPSGKIPSPGGGAPSVPTKYG